MLRVREDEQIFKDVLGLVPELHGFAVQPGWTAWRKPCLHGLGKRRALGLEALKPSIPHELLVIGDLAESTRGEHTRYGVIQTPSLPNES